MEQKLRLALIIMGMIFLISLTVFVNTLISAQAEKNKVMGLDAQNIPTIIVSGEGKVSVSPDVAEISFSVITTDDTVEEALGKNNDKMQRVIGYLKNERVEDKDIQTSSFNVRPLYRYEEDRITGTGERILYAYEVSNSISVNLKDFGKINTVIDGAVRSGANNVSGLRFIVSDKEAYKKQAREEAIGMAKQKASEISLSLGVSLGRVLDFSEDYYSPISAMRGYDMAMDSIESSVPIEVGENEISVSVTVRYEIK